MQHYSDIIFAPVITEKSTVVKENRVYTFKCNKKATKNQIKMAIEQAFGVHVTNVNTLNTKAKDKRVGKYSGKTKTYKKAMVTLAPNESIEI
jgi:large subunit ribosomal protein L23